MFSDPVGQTAQLLPTLLGKPYPGWEQCPSVLRGGAPRKGSAPEQQMVPKTSA